MSEINENNIMMANFMDWKSHDGYITTHYSTYKGVDGNLHETTHCRISDMKFHRSWDWLIPVLEKIMDICLNYENDYGDFYGIREHIPDIDQTYKAIVVFIKMYNKKNESTKLTR